MKWPFVRAKAQPPPPRSMADFLDEAAREIDQQIAQDPLWHQHLPYRSMPPDRARAFEIEKRAIWRRVIHDAGRSEITALVWTTREDDLVCSACRERQGQRFAKADLRRLAKAPVHLGCRCELMPVR